MKKLIALYFFFLTISTINAQITRYPYVQSVTTNSAIIAWRTSNPVLGSVRYGVNAANLNLVATASGTNTQHGVLLQNLQENTRYYYAIYAGTTLLASEFFYTAKDSTEQQFSFIQYGDCGFNTTVQAQIGALMEADSAEFAVVCGDIDQGGVPHISESQGGDNYDDIFFNVYNNGTSTKMLSKECHYTAIGNHDYYANNGAEYDNSFYLPHNNSENSERYYSFTWGDAKYIALDVITPFDNTVFPINFADLEDRWWTDFRQGSPQYEFLENELKCNDKKWVFIYFHEGPWTNYWGADYNIPTNLGGDYYQFDGNVMVRNHLVPLFEEYDVDFVLAGHSHLYERGEKNGVTYVTSGSAGDSNPGGNILYANHPEIQLAILDNVYTRYKVNNNSVRIECINKNNIMVDTLTKTKNYTPFTVAENVQNPTCFNGTDGAIQLNITGPKGPYTIEWFDNSSTSFNRTNLAAGTYFANVFNKYGCEKVISVSVTEPPMLIPQIVSLTGNALFCQGDSIVLKTSENYISYSWSNGEIDDQISINTPQNIQVNVVNSSGCSGTSSNFSVGYLPMPVAQFNQANSGFNFNFLANNNSNATYFVWHFDDGSNDTTSSATLMSHTFTTDGYYDVSLYAVNACGTDTFTKTIKVGNGGSLAINDNEPLEMLSVYPNPMSEKAVIDAASFVGLLTIAIYDSNGVLVQSFKTRKTTIEIERKELVAGKYYISISDKRNKKGLAKLLIL